MNGSPLRRSNRTATFGGFALVALVAGSIGFLPGTPASGSTLVTNVGVQTNKSLQVETSVALDRADNMKAVVAYNDQTPRNGAVANCGYGFTIDGGATWSTSFLKGITIGNGGPYERGADPGVVYSVKHDVFYFVCIGWDSGFTRSAVEVASSSDHGATWSATTVLASAGSEATKVDKPAIFIDNISTSVHYGRVYVAWTRNDPREIDLSYLNGTAWSTPNKISGSLSDTIGPSLAVGGKSGQVYAAWCWSALGGCTGENAASMFVTRSGDGGDTWTKAVKAASFVDEPALLDGTTENHTFPSLSVNPFNGYVRLAYPVWNGSDSDVMFTRSKDDGKHWKTPIVVNSNTKDDQFFPWIGSAAHSSAIWVCYYDEGWNAGKLDVSCSRSTSGTSFDPAVRVSTASSPLPSWAGDYIGADVTTGGGFVAAWADFRTSGHAGDAYFGAS